MNPPPRLSPVEPPAAAPAPAPAPASWQAAPKESADPKEVVRRVALILALGFLGISLVVAYYSANSIVSIWFENQWVPVARLVLALGIAAVAVWAVLRLTARR